MSASHQSAQGGRTVALPTTETSLAVALPYWLDRDPNEAMEVARAADACGFEELWIGEMATFDAFALAGAIARETSRIGLVIGPLPVTLRDPVALAMGSTSVSEIGGRPSALALGASSPTVLSAWHGVETAASLQAFDDTVTALRQILSGERTRYDLANVRSEGFRLRLGLGSPVSLGMAAFGPRMVDLAAEIADRVVLAHTTPAQIAVVRERIDRRAAELGRESPSLSVWMAAAHDEAQVAQVMRGLVAYIGQPGYRTMFTNAGFGDFVEYARSGVGPKQVLAAMPIELADAVAGIGTAEQIMGRVRACGDAGADQVCIVPATAGDDTAAEVLSSLSPS
ncbi:LLM class F420-dependent oxidoreductase [Ilumatobacter sp.]|uniref:LLM class F420-dependent oxidoreductase n=1 Tax=Ilumatobacter sp. TaxID=1967498 RepID=UPI003B52B96B